MSTNPWDAFPDTDESGRRLAEWLLVESFDDLRARIAPDASRYDRLGISAVLRRTLTDKRPVLSLARARLALPEPDFSFTAWSGPEQEPNPGGLMLVFDWAKEFDQPSVTTNLEGFLKAEVGRFFREPVTVLQLVRYFAHTYGGVHLGVPENDFEAAAQRFAASHPLLSGGWDSTLARVGNVVVEALSPLVDAIRETPYPPVEALRDFPAA